jgi:MoaA/NifB/PqqE/SkfB family radical SAM enzyme
MNIPRIERGAVFRRSNGIKNAGKADEIMLRVIRNVFLKRPILTIYDVTKQCNQRCGFCNIWKTQSDDMDLPRIVEFAEKLRKFGIGYVFIQGGEPTLRKDLLEIVDIFIKNKIKPTVITNGILLTDDIAEKIAGRRCNLAVSIDSLEKEYFTQIRGVDRLEKVLENVTSISKFRTRKGNWAITTTVTNLTKLSDVLAIERFAKQHGFMYAVRPYIHTKGIAGKQNDDMSYQDQRSTARVLEIFEYMLGQARRENYLASLVYEEHIKYLRGEKMPICDAMRYSMLLQENGRFSPCIEFPDKSIELGDFTNEKRKYRDIFCQCNEKTPCFYNDAREIGIVWRKKWRIFFRMPVIVRQLMKYGNFFML